MLRAASCFGFAAAICEGSGVMVLEHHSSRDREQQEGWCASSYRKRKVPRVLIQVLNERIGPWSIDSNGFLLFIRRVLAQSDRPRVRKSARDQQASKQQKPASYNVLVHCCTAGSSSSSTTFIPVWDMECLHEWENRPSDRSTTCRLLVLPHTTNYYVALLY